MRLKRTATDSIVSDLVREAADWCCERCGRPFPERKSQALHCSHFFSRIYLSTRYFIDNLSSLCAACHDFLGKNPHEHVAFVRKKLGDVRYEMLCARKQKIYRYRNSDRAEMRKHFAAELMRLLGIRERGVVGPIEVVAYD